MQTNYEKIVENGKVAILRTNNYGFGWYSEHKKLELLFDPFIINLVKNNVPNRAEIIKMYVETKYDVYIPTLGAENLIVDYYDEGTIIEICNFDGCEAVREIANVSDVIIVG